MTATHLKTKASRETFTICFRASSSISDHGKNVTILSLPAWLGLVDTAMPDWVVADGRNWNRLHDDYSNPILVLTLEPSSEPIVEALSGQAAATLCGVLRGKRLIAVHKL